MMTCNSPLLLERQSHGWNITQMAKYLGVDPTAYHEIEQGYRVPAKVTRERIHKKLGISEEILLQMLYLYGFVYGAAGCLRRNIPGVRRATGAGTWVHRIT